MDKTAIKNFAIWARNKLITDISYRAGLMGITENGIASALPQSTGTTEFYDIGTVEPYSISGEAIKQRKKLAEIINRKAEETDYATAYKYIIEEVAYTWFNRLIAVRFMEVNDYLPSHIRVLSSESNSKMEPDLVTTPFDAELEFTSEEKSKIIQLKNDNELDELFRLLFIKQCNALNEILPALFEKTSDYTELLLNISVIDQEGVVYHMIHDIPEENFNVERGGQVEIIGWLYQYYNDEKKNEIINIYKGTVRKEDIPAATQLFTTDWVVRYIIDNSLGKYWIERNPSSSLVSKLDFYVTGKNNEIEVVDEKITPEELTVFDPCMGSAHFLVYAFNVLMEIYDECGYSEREAAKSILESNLYGIDIDNRAFQIAYFAVMMKARQYNRRILNGNTVCHVYSIQESNGINKEHIKYFGKELNEVENKEALSQMYELINAFYNAKEYGTIINVKNLNWELLNKFISEHNAGGQISLDTVGIDETKEQLSFMIKIGQVLAKKYCVVATNPPYLNKMDSVLKKFVNENYKEYSGDLFSVFMYRNFGYCKEGGYSGFMTPFVWMFIKTYESLRRYIIENKNIVSLIQMEYSAFEEATVPICSFVLKNKKESTPGYYFKLSEFKGGMNVQKEKVLEALRNKDSGYFYETVVDNFSKIPGCPVAYWVRNNYIKICAEGVTINTLASPKTGMTTGENNRFLRMWYEIADEKMNTVAMSDDEASKSGAKWFPYLKGGDFRRWYGNYDYVINWENNGFEIKNNIKPNGLKAASVRSEKLYFKPLISWSAVSSGIFSCRLNNKGALFDSGGSSLYVTKDRLYLLALLNSKIGQYALNLSNPTINYQPGDIANIPLKIVDREGVEKIAQQNVELCRIDWDSFETSWDFQKHPLIQFSDFNPKQIKDDRVRYISDMGKIEDAFHNWNDDCNSRFNTLKANEEELNRIFIEIYGLQEGLTPEVEDKDVTVRKADLQRDIKSLISYAVGCMFGRYSLDVEGLVYAGGEWDDSKYSCFIPDNDNIIPITDEEYLEDDIVARLCEWLKIAYGEETLEENLDFIANALGNKGNTSREIIRNYFLKDFFKDHCKIYQKRPIYWLYDSGKQNGFKALIYLHRYNADIIGNLRVDYLHRMQRVYESEISRMQDMIDNSGNAREVGGATKRKEKLLKQLKECQEYDEKIGHLALSRIELDLDDGVKVNYEKAQTGSDGKKYQVLAKI